MQWWSPLELKLLRMAAKVSLAHLLSQCRSLLAFPVQVYHVLVALLGKDAGGTGPIALLTMLYRLWARIYGDPVADWQDARRLLG